MKFFLMTLILTLSSLALTVGEIPPSATLSGENGGCIDGSEWSADTLHGKVYVLFYIDPDHKEDMDAFIDELHTKNYDPAMYGSIAIINLQATWLPNFAIEKKLQAKQKEFPNTL